jgi:DNA-binding XRE family transcriptional regulator
MRHGTVNERGQALERSVEIRATVTRATIIRLEVLLPRYGLTRSQAVEEALCDWTLSRERALNREGRLELEKRMRRAMDRGPVEEMVYRSVRQDFVRGVDVPPGPVVGLAAMPVLVPQLKARRVAVGLSQQALAEAAGCSIQVLRAYEGGIVPQRSEVLPRIERALDEAEQATV